MLSLTVDCSFYLIWKWGSCWMWPLDKGVIIPPKHLIPPLAYPKVSTSPILWLVFPIRFIRMVVCYRPFHPHNQDTHFRHYVQGDLLEKMIHNNMSKFLDKMAQEKEPFIIGNYLHLMMIHQVYTIFFGEK
jgi:hypothetical protein